MPQTWKNINKSVIQTYRTILIVESKKRKQLVERKTTNEEKNGSYKYPKIEEMRET